jgi:superfamily I DNA/RNA helicase
MRYEGTVGVIVADAAVAGVGKLLDSWQIGYDVLGEDPEIFETHGDLSRSDAELAPSLRPILVPAALSKGLEFDHVVLLEPADIVAGEPDEVTGLRRLYVCLTRAVTSLIVVYASDLPAALQRESVLRKEATQALNPSTQPNDGGSVSGSLT